MTFDKDIIVGIGTVLTGIVGLLGFILGIYNYRHTRKAAFINTVTAERVKWISKVRENISTFCGIYYTLVATPFSDNEDDNKFLREKLAKIDILKYEIKLQLNPHADLDTKIIDLIEEMPKHTDSPAFPDLEKTIDNLTKATQELLKQEWERVKKESINGSLSEATKIDKIKTSILHRYKSVWNFSKQKWEGLWKSLQ